MKEEKRIGCIDGIKAVAMLLVFNIHFLNAYYCGIYTLNPADFHTKIGVEWWIGATPLNFIYAGKLGARVFLVLSAFLLAYGFFQKPDRRKLLFSPVKKYMRLVIPAAVVNFVAVLLMNAGAYYNKRAAVLAGSEEFFGVYNQFPADMKEALKEAFIGCFFSGSNAYNGPLWFMQYEFLGCLFIAMALYFLIRRVFWFRMAAYTLLSVLLIRTDYLGMILGVALADVMCAGEAEKLLQKITAQKWLLWLLLFIGLYFGTYPSYGNAAGTIYAAFPPKVLFYYNVSIPLILFALLHLEAADKLLSAKILRRFTSVSYSFYLVHFPVLCTVSAAFFVAMYGKINYHALAVITYLLTFLASFFIAWLMTKGIERPCRIAAEKVEDKIL